MMDSVQLLAHQAGVNRQVVNINLDGVSHDASLVTPQPAGNSINWVLGHLITVYNDLLPLLGESPACPADQIARYKRGSSPLDPAKALPLDDLRQLWDVAAQRIDAGIANLPAARLDDAAPASPTEDPNETVGSLLSTVMFHQSYHAGQLGLLRRVAGLRGAIP
jgi:uncharacterized damage-inducible protein DinB